MKVAIIGGGASGLVCAITAKQKAGENNISLDVTVFETADRVGKKILATGNGRCNMLNEDENPFYFSCNSFHSYAVKRYSAQSHKKFFASLGLYTRTDEEGRVYPLSNQATTVLDCLRNECARLGVIFKTDSRITEIKKVSDGYLLNSEMKYDKVVLACGGKACVKSFNGYDLLRSIGHKVTDVSPSLTKLETADTKTVRRLQGIRHKVKLTLTDAGRFVAEEKGEILFASYGISGIAVMQLSAYITRYKSNSWVVYADLIPDMSFEFIKKAVCGIINHNPSAPCSELLMGFMPKKIGEAVIRATGAELSADIGRLSDEKINVIIRKAKKYPFAVTGLRTFEEAQVTAGGADTAFFNNKTMESTLHKGLYAIGELLDVDGLCGGYNLMWAWSSGRLCGESLIK